METKPEMITESESENEQITINESQFLTFELKGDVYGLGILHIKEILQFSSVTRVPMVPDFVRGVINLRGNVVPVIDLNVRFGAGRSEVGKRTCIVILEIRAGDDRMDVGIMVDAVNEVLDIAPNDIEPPPPFGANIRTDYISGMGQVGENFIVLLNPDSVLSLSELTLLEGLTEDASPELSVSAPAPDP